MLSRPCKPKGRCDHCKWTCCSIQQSISVALKLESVQPVWEQGRLLLVVNRKEWQTDEFPRNKQQNWGIAQFTHSLTCDCTWTYTSTHSRKQRYFCSPASPSLSCFPFICLAGRLHTVATGFLHRMSSFEKQSLWPQTNCGQCFHNPSEQKCAYFPTHSYFSCSDLHLWTQSLPPFAPTKEQSKAISWKFLPSSF